MEPLEGGVRGVAGQGVGGERRWRGWGSVFLESSCSTLDSTKGLFEPLLGLTPQDPCDPLEAQRGHPKRLGRVQPVPPFDGLKDHLGHFIEPLVLPETSGTAWDVSGGVDGGFRGDEGDNPRVDDIVLFKAPIPYLLLPPLVLFCSLLGVQIVPPRMPPTTTPPRDEGKRRRVALDVPRTILW